MLNSRNSRICRSYIARARERLATVTLSPGQLWAGAGAAWGATGAVAACGLPESVYQAVLGMALMVTLAAIQCAAITRRLDRQYMAMMQAAIQSRFPVQDPPAERAGAVVSLRDTARAARGASGE